MLPYFNYYPVWGLNPRPHKGSRALQAELTRPMPDSIGCVFLNHTSFLVISFLFFLIEYEAVPTLLVPALPLVLKNMYPATGGINCLRG